MHPVKPLWQSLFDHLVLGLAAHQTYPQVNREQL
jgi:hypothetical protein